MHMYFSLCVTHREKYICIHIAFYMGVLFCGNKEIIYLIIRLARAIFQSKVLFNPIQFQLGFLDFEKRRS